MANLLLRNNILRVFRSNHHCSWKFHKFHRETTVLESLFFLKMMKLYKDICSAWISRTSAESFFLLIDWRHKRLKNTIDLFLFYGEHFCGISESDLSKCREKKVLFCTYCKGLFCFLKIVIMLIFLRICIKYSQH